MILAADKVDSHNDRYDLSIWWSDTFEAIKTIVQKRRIGFTQKRGGLITYNHLYLLKQDVKLLRKEDYFHVYLG